MTLHEIEDLARYEDLESPRGRALQRLYARKLNALWQGKVTMAEVCAHEARRIHRFMGPDYFRARTIARNAIDDLHARLSPARSRSGRRERPVDAPEDLAELAVKVARAVRKVRPELFQPGVYQGVGWIDRA